MADELIFDSERQMLRAEKKRRLVPLLALAAVLVLILAVLLILRGCRAESHTGGENTDYLYTWSLKSNGDAELVVPHSDAPDYRWDLKDGGESLPALRVTRVEKERRDGTAFTLHPEAVGRSMITLVLKGEDNSVVPNYQMTLLTEVTEADERLSVNVLNSSGIRYQPEIVGRVGGGNGVDETGNNYRIYTDERSDLVLSFPVGEYERDWSHEITEGADSLAFLGLLYEDGNMKVRLRAGEAPGQSKLVLTSTNAATTITVQLESGADGSLKVLSHQAESGEKPEIATLPEIPTDSGGDAIVVTTGDIPIFSDDHHLEVLDDPSAETVRP